MELDTMDRDCGDFEEDDDYVYDMSLLPSWVNRVLADPYYSSDVEGSRPIRPRWPKDSSLSRDHFTIDEQQCLECKKKVGYAMPMNKAPNSTFLFCHGPDGEQICGVQRPLYLPCYLCGNINNETTGALCSRPGNSAYDGPSNIFQFVCFYCHKEQMMNEPGVEECRERMKLIREERRKDEQLRKSFSSSSSSSSSNAAFYKGEEEQGDKKKRKRG